MRRLWGRPVQRSFDDLGTPLADVTFCVLDLETTGGNRDDDAITEVGAVKVRGGECLGTFQTLVNPGRAIPPQITVLTGLTDALVGPAPRIEAVLPSLLEFLGGTVIVGHNIGFDLAFLRAAFERAGHPRFDPVRVDTVALARRLVRDEVPDCRLGTLASRFRLDHRPTHRALDDALATTDLLHLLIERAAGLGVLGLDDLTTLASMAGHPQAAKLKLTSNLPRSPGVYLFCGHRDEVLYVGKATNLRQRVRSYFGQEDRRRIGPMLREAQSVRHHCLPDALSAEVVEARLIARLLPRYNRAGTRADRYCYVRLDVDSAWPRLAIVKDAAALRRCTSVRCRRARWPRWSSRRCRPPCRCGAARCASAGRHQPPPDATPCAAAQMGVAACPCAGLADRRALRRRRRRSPSRRSTGRPDAVVERLTGADDGARRRRSATRRRRWPATACRRSTGAIRRTRQMDDLLGARLVRDRRRGDVTWVVDRARLVDVRVAGSTAGALPAAAARPADARPPAPPRPRRRGPRPRPQAPPTCF